MKNLKQKLSAIAVLAVGVVGSAHAAIDLTDATAAIDDGVVAATAIGVAFLAFKIIKRVLARL